MDPPAYGHGQGGKIWDIHRDLPVLAALLPSLLSDDPLFIVLSCHDLAWPKDRMHELLYKHTVGSGLGGKIEVGDLVLTPGKIRDVGAGDAARGKALPCGVHVRWSAE